MSTKHTTTPLKDFTDSQLSLLASTGTALADALWQMPVSTITAEAWHSLTYLSAHAQAEIARRAGEPVTCDPDDTQEVEVVVVEEYTDDKLEALIRANAELRNAGAYEDSFEITESGRDVIAFLNQLEARRKPYTHWLDRLG